MDQVVFCQSCGMPLESDDVKGTEKDGSKSECYCSYCYQNGSFTQDITMDEMIEINLNYLDEWNKGAEQKVTVEQAREQLRQFLPTLKRWQP